MGVFEQELHVARTVQQDYFNRALGKAQFSTVYFAAAILTSVAAETDTFGDPRKILLGPAIASALSGVGSLYAAMSDTLHGVAVEGVIDRLTPPPRQPYDIEGTAREIAS